MQRALQPFRAIALWLASATVGFAFVLSFELLRRTHVDDPLGELAYLLRLALAVSLTTSLPLLVLHGARWVLHERPRLANVLTTLAVVAAAWVPGFRAAHTFATGGQSALEAVPNQATVLLVGGGFVLGHVLLWLYHLFAMFCAERESVDRRLRIAHFLTGLLAVGILVRALNFELGAYAYLAETLVRPLWLVSASMLFALAAGFQLGLRTIASATLTLLAAIAALSVLLPQAIERSRTAYLQRGRMVALTELVMYPPTQAPVGLTVSEPGRFACKRHPKSRKQPALDLKPEQRRNVILISIDALRRDALDWKVNGRSVMPAIKRFGKTAVRHDRAVTTYPATLMAVGGALTGLDPSQLMLSPKPPTNIFTATTKVFPRRVAILPKSRWFSTAVVETMFVRGASFALEQGAERQTARMIAALNAARRANERILAWVHYFEPHHKYYTHEGFDYGNSTRERYMSELSYVDAQVGRLVSYLERARFFEDSLVILFADHGEAMGERDYYGHHVYLNSWITDVPLMHRAPNTQPKRSKTLADVTDVAATVLHFADVKKPWDIVGKSLLAPAKQRARRVSFAEAFPVRGAPLFKLAKKPTASFKSLVGRLDKLHAGGGDYSPKVSAVTSSHRLIVDRLTGVEELYDRKADPEERHDLSKVDVFERQRLRQRIEAWSQAQAEKLYCKVIAEQKARKKAKAAQGLLPLGAPITATVPGPAPQAAPAAKSAAPQPAPASAKPTEAAKTP